MNIGHEFTEFSDCFIEVFQEETILVVIKNTAHIWYSNLAKGDPPTSNAFRRNHRVLSGCWSLRRLTDESQQVISFLAAKYMTAPKCLSYWSVIFLTKQNTVYRIAINRILLSNEYYDQEIESNGKESLIVHEFTESSPVTHSIENLRILST